MNFDLLSRVIHELSSLIVGARVDRVYQGASSLYLIMGTRARKFILLLSPDRMMPRMHLVRKKPTADDLPHSFILFIRSRLSGAQVRTVALLGQDRIVEMRFSRSGHEFGLVFELFGHAPNFVFTDQSGRILAAYHSSASVEHAVRALLTGRIYVPPENHPDFASVVIPVTIDEAAPGSPNEEAEAYYAQLIQQKQVLALRAELHARLAAAHTRLDRLKSALMRDLNSAGKADEYRKAGDLVLANLHTISAGSSSADLAGYDGNTVSVSLDPKHSPAWNAESYFKRYKKAKSGRDIITSRLKQTEIEQEQLYALMSELEQAGDLDDLQCIRTELEQQWYDRKRNVKGKAPAASPALPLKKVEFQGWDILVGKNAAGNDYLSTKIARAEDLWLHAEGLPGSHVLVRNPEKRDIPQAVFLKAAALAAFYSKGKNAEKVSVTYTQAGLVRKPKGAKPGLVTLAGRKSIMVKPEDA